MKKVAILAVLVAMMFGCETKRTITKQAQPTMGTRLYGYEKVCSGKVYMKTFEQKHDGGCAKKPNVWEEAEDFSKKHRVLKQRNVYHPEFGSLEYIELTVCIEPGK